MLVLKRIDYFINVYLRSKIFGFYEKIILRFFRFAYRSKENDIKGVDDISVFVYIPTYNRGEVLVERALKSVLLQSHKKMKVLVVGDGCTDNTEELVSQINDSRVTFVNLYPRVKRNYPDEPFFHWLNGPIVPSNYALSVVEGDYIARIDDDDIWHPDHIEKLLKYAIDGNYEFVSSHKSAVTDDGEVIVDKAYPVKHEYYTQNNSDNQADLGPRIGGSSNIFYKSYLSFIKFNPHAWKKKWNKNNDIDFILRIHMAGVKIGFLDEITVETLPRPGKTLLGSKVIEELTSGELY